LQLSAFGPNGRFGSRARMSNTQPLVAAAAGVPQRADPLPLAPAMTVAGHVQMLVKFEMAVNLECGFR
jgi:hypothetical protein